MRHAVEYMLLDKTQECIGSFVLLTYFLGQMVACLIGSRDNVWSGSVMPLEYVSMHILL